MKPLTGRVIVRGEKADFLSGGRGGPGRDDLDGGRGDERIDAADGTRDNVLCAGGRDRVQVDPEDRLSRCERVVER